MAGADVSQAILLGERASSAFARWRAIEAGILEVLSSEVAVDRNVDATPAELIPR